MRPSFVCETNGMLKRYIVVNVLVHSPDGSSFLDSCFDAVCIVCYCGARCVCRLHAEWVVVTFRTGEYSVIGCCVKSCGGCRRGAVRAWCSPLAVGLRSSLIRLCGARRHQWVFVASFQPAFLRYDFKLLFQCFSCKTFLSCCTTRAMAIGVTERNRRCVH